MEEKKELFWADQLARKIIDRQTFRYSELKVPKFSQYTVKTSASISGVLHIGRLSDTIRGASVARALKDANVKSKLIWVAEDMDPLRKIPEGVPDSFEKYIGAPVSTIPDPEGCHKTYANHHTDEYFKVLHKFTYEPMEKFSMQDEYNKGNFKNQIKKILDHSDIVKEIQNKHRTNPLRKNWCPWSPVCANCGKIMTPRVKIDEGIVKYKCEDYAFETKIAKGCGHKDDADPLKDAGKLAWKSEWAAQWDRWKIVSEGAGKEYQVPNSAYWINAEIVERVLDYPSPEAIFYEHIMIDGVKMSASLGNVIYPKDWLEVASPQLLRFYYNKRLMMTRSFSWKDLPQLYDEYENAALLYSGNEKLENEKESAHLKRMFEISNQPAELDEPVGVTFMHASVLAQTFSDKDAIMQSLKKTGQYNEKTENEVMQLIEYSKNWIKLHAPEQYKFAVQNEVNDFVKQSLTKKQKTVLEEFAKLLSSKEWDEKELFNESYEICKKLDIKPAEFFKAAYLVLLGKERGPRLIPFVLSLGERATKLFESV